MSGFADSQRAARSELAAALEIMDVAQRIAAMTDACIETGGSLIPAGTGRWGPHFAEISCLGVSTSGNDEAEAVAHWIKAVHRMETDLVTDAAA